MASTTLAFDIFARDRNATRTFDRIGRSADQLDGRFARVSRTMAKVGRIAATGLAAGIGVAAVGMRHAVSDASDLEETLSKAAKVFGPKSLRPIEQFADRAAQALGQSKREALDAASTFAIFGQAAGLQQRELVRFSTELTTLASDLASFGNTSPEDAIVALGAALRGENEPIRRYNVLLDDATLRQRALKMGLVSTTKDALTPQQKVLAAHAEIMEQTAIAQGDFADTSDGLANKQRQLRAQLEDLSAEIGKKLLPAFVGLATWVNDEGLPALERFGDWFTETGLPKLKRFADNVQEFAEMTAPAAESAIGDVTGALGDLGDAFGLVSRREEKASESTADVTQMLSLLAQVELFTVATNVRVLAKAFEVLTINLRKLGDALVWFADKVNILDNIGRSPGLGALGGLVGDLGLPDLPGLPKGGGGNKGRGSRNRAPDDSPFGGRNRPDIGPALLAEARATRQAVTRRNRPDPMSAGWAAL